MGTPSARPAAQPLESYLPRIESLLRQVIERAGFDMQFAVRAAPRTLRELEATEYVVDFSGSDSDLLLVGGASLLTALEYVVLKAMRLGEELFGKISFDCRDWRETRAQELKLMAQVAAERVAETGDAFSLNPMSARERRIVHLALKDLPQVRTVSEGFGPERKVVILPTSPPVRKF